MASKPHNSHLAEKATISYGKNIEVMFATIRYIVIVGNMLFILWITFNGIDEGFSGTIIQKVSYISLIVLLVLNIALLWRTRQKPS